MSKSWPLNLRRKLVTFRGRSDTVSERAKRLLVKTLYTQPSTLAIGAFNGVASTAIAAWVSRLDILYLGCVVLTLIAAARIVTALKLARKSMPQPANLKSLTRPERSAMPWFSV